jgi:hypothetical protein
VSFIGVWKIQINIWITLRLDTVCINFSNHVDLLSFESSLQVKFENEVVEELETVFVRLLNQYVRFLVLKMRVKN